MQIIEFSDFARRRMERGAQGAASNAAPALPVTDRWAQLHSPEAEVRTLTQRAPDLDDEDVDFWSDLHFRLAYPTHRMRHH